MSKYYPPRYAQSSFHCPWCDVNAKQYWNSVILNQGNKSNLNLYYLDSCETTDSIFEIAASTCSHCWECIFWRNKKVIYPKIFLAPLPTEDMPESVKEFYDEARSISNDSPRGALALLRVALEKLTEYFDETEGTLNERIGKLKSQGLPQEVIDSLDTIRIHANESGAHSGSIDFDGDDGEERVSKMFKLLNIIVERTITNPKEIAEEFSTLPKDKKAGISQRDKNN